MSCLPSSFEVLLWNMQKCNGKKWHADFLRLIANRHLLLLQEASLTAVNLELFDEHEKYFWTMARSFTHIKSKSENGVKTGCRSMPLDSKCFASPSFEPFVRTHKMLLQTSYHVQGCAHKLLVLNVHALNFSRLGGYKKHLQQIQDSARHHHGPIILAGDFNTWSKVRYSLLQKMAHELGLSEAVISRKTKARHFYSHLDHLFYRGLRLNNIELFKSVTSSDHLPITARFSTN